MSGRQKEPAAGPTGFLVGVYGPFGSRALIEVPTRVAEELIGEELIDPAPVRIVEAARRDIDELRRRDPVLADSALAASVESMAMELASPGNSATSKAQCARAMSEALAQLRELAPAKEVPADRIDEVNRKREQRRNRRSSA